MKKGWTTTKLLIIGGLAGLDVVLALTGGVITAITGIPLGGGVINNLVENSIIILCLLLVNKFGTATLLRFVLSILQLPLPILGTSGFSPKIVIGVIAGLFADVLYHFFKGNRRLAAFITGGLPQVWIVTSIVTLGRLFGMPGVEKTAKVIMSPPLLLGAVVLGGIGGYLGYLIYQKIKDTAVVKRIQGG